MGEAVGILEVFGLVCAFMAADAGSPAGDHQIQRQHIRRGSCHGSGRADGKKPYRSRAEAYHSQAHRGYGKNVEALRI